MARKMTLAEANAGMQECQDRWFELMSEVKRKGTTKARKQQIAAEIHEVLRRKDEFRLAANALLNA